MSAQLQVMKLPDVHSYPMYISRPVFRTHLPLCSVQFVLSQVFHFLHEKQDHKLVSPIATAPLEMVLYGIHDLAPICQNIRNICLTSLS